MGSDAAVYLFDYHRYQDEIIPALHRLLLDGTLPSWIEAVLERLPWGGASVEEHFSPHLRQYAADLVHYCHYLTGDFAFPGSRHPVNWNDRVDWRDRRCASTTCPERHHCPFHALQRAEGAEEFNWLFELAVSAFCLGESQFVGRSVNPYWYEELLKRFHVPDDHPLYPLLHHLGSRGFVVGYQFSNSDGIHGWLTPPETQQLAQHLAGLPLPHYEPTFAAMEQFRTTRPGPYACEGVPFKELSLSFVRTVATIAATCKQGLLWGNDISPLR